MGFLLALAGTTFPCWGAEFHVTKTGDSVVDPKALTIQGSFGQAINGKSFQQDALVSHNGYQYVGYYDAARHVCLARRKLPDGAWAIIRFGDYHFKSNDAHNTISLGICPQDGTIHMAFDHHANPLHYRVSRKGVATDPKSVEWQASLFGPVISHLGKDKLAEVTYPRFWQTPNGGLQFCYRRGRSGDGDRMLVDYHPESGLWGNARQIDSRKGVFRDWLGKTYSTRCSYPNGYNYGPDGKLHVSWVWREQSRSGGSNHDLLYAYSEDQGNTWYNNNGERLTEPAHLNSPGITVAKIHRGYGLLNTHGQAVDSKGRMHFVVKYCTDETLQAAGSRPGEHLWGPPEARRYHHYWRDDSAVWHHVELPGVAGNRPKLFIDKGDNAYLIFCDTRDSRDLDPSRGNLKIMAATPKKRWEDWKVIHVERGPFCNEMLGDYYRWQQEGILSVIVQGLPEKPHQATSLRILDFVVGKE